MCGVTGCWICVVSERGVMSVSARDLMAVSDRMTVSSVSDAVVLFLIGLGTALFIAVCMRLVRDYGPRPKYLRVISAAKRAGRCSTGRLVRKKLCRGVRRDRYRDETRYETIFYWAGWYEYEVHGMSYRVKFDFSKLMPGALPKELLIYHPALRPWSGYTDFDYVTNRRPVGFLLTACYAIPVIFGIFAFFVLAWFFV